MDDARRWLYHTIMSRIQQTTGSEYTIAIAAKTRPRTVTKRLDDGSRLEVELTWGRDAPQVIWAARIFVVDGEELSFPLPLELIRLVAARDRPAADAAPDE
jgi:hypothetical protein